MVLGRVDTRLPHRISGRPRSGGQCNINTELREIIGNKHYSYAYEGYTHGTGSSQ